MVHNESGKPVVLFTEVLAPPVIGRRAALGGIENHPRLGNLDWVNTSGVLEVRDDGRTIETRNTIYIKKE